jgi:hypothetical protein
MGLRAGALEVGVLAAFAMRPVTRHVGEAVGCLLLSVHLFLLAIQLTLSLLVALAAAGGTARPPWRLRKGQAWPARPRECSGLRPLLSVWTGREPMRLAFGSFASWIICFCSWGWTAGAVTSAIYGAAQLRSVGQVAADL